MRGPTNNNTPPWVKRLVKQWAMDDELFERLEAGDLSVIAPVYRLVYGANGAKRHPLEVADQPLDRPLLYLSRVYRTSRKLFLQTGGRHVPKYLSKPRALTMGTLLDRDIHFSPVNDEFVWLSESMDYQRQFEPQVLYQLKESITPLFHEQNHRILWQVLPRPASGIANTRRYLHLAEAIAVTLDFLCAHELGNTLGEVFNNCGVITSIGEGHLEDATRSEGVFRRYLEAYTYTSFLNLELYKPSDLIPLNQACFVDLGPLAETATKHALSNLSVDFVRVTCPAWERKHLSTAMKVLRRAKKKQGDDLSIPVQPLNPGTVCHLTRGVLKLFLDPRSSATSSNLMGMLPERAMSTSRARRRR